MDAQSLGEKARISLMKGASWYKLSMWDYRATDAVINTIFSGNKTVIVAVAAGLLGVVAFVLAAARKRVFGPKESICIFVSMIVTLFLLEQIKNTKTLELSFSEKYGDVKLDLPENMFFIQFVGSKAAERVEKCNKDGLIRQRAEEKDKGMYTEMMRRKINSSYSGPMGAQPQGALGEYGRGKEGVQGKRERERNVSDISDRSSFCISREGAPTNIKNPVIINASAFDRVIDEFRMARDVEEKYTKMKKGMVQEKKAYERKVQELLNSHRDFQEISPLMKKELLGMDIDPSDLSAKIKEVYRTFDSLFAGLEDLTLFSITMSRDSICLNTLKIPPPAQSIAEGDVKGGGRGGKGAEEKKGEEKKGKGREVGVITITDITEALPPNTNTPGHPGHPKGREGERRRERRREGEKEKQAVRDKDKGKERERPRRKHLPPTPSYSLSDDVVLQEESDNTPPPAPAPQRRCAAVRQPDNCVTLQKCRVVFPRRCAPAVPIINLSPFLALSRAVERQPDKKPKKRKREVTSRNPLISSIYIILDVSEILLLVQAFLIFGTIAAIVFNIRHVTTVIYLSLCLSFCISLVLSFYSLSTANTLAPLCTYGLGCPGRGEQGGQDADESVVVRDYVGKVRGMVKESEMEVRRQMNLLIERDPLPYIETLISKLKQLEYVKNELSGLLINNRHREEISKGDLYTAVSKMRGSLEGLKSINAKIRKSNIAEVYHDLSQLELLLNNSSNLYVKNTKKNIANQRPDDESCGGKEKTVCVLSKAFDALFIGMGVSSLVFLWLFAL